MSPSLPGIDVIGVDPAHIISRDVERVYKFIYNASILLLGLSMQVSFPG